MPPLENSFGSLPPPGTVPIRRYLRALGVPDELIQWDDRTGEVRVGNQVVRPAANLSPGITYADPQVLEQAARAAARAGPRTFDLITDVVARNPFAGPLPTELTLMRNFAALGQALPVLGGAIQAMRGFPLTLEAVRTIADLTGRLPYSGAPTFPAQQATAALTRDIAATAGAFPRVVPELAGQFAPILEQFAGRPTEQRRSNIAREALTARQIDIDAARLQLAREQFEAEKKRDAQRQQFLQQLGARLESGALSDPKDIVRFALQAGQDLDDGLGRVLYAYQGSKPLTPTDLEELVRSDPEFASQYTSVAAQLGTTRDPQARATLNQQLEVMRDLATVRYDAALRPKFDAFVELARTQGLRAAIDTLYARKMPSQEVSAILSYYLYQNGYSPEQIPQVMPLLFQGKPLPAPQQRPRQAPPAPSADAWRGSAEIPSYVLDMLQRLAEAYSTRPRQPYAIGR